MFAGADWIKAHRCKSMSPFGEKVANVLGQVNQGIYHLEADLDYVNTDWESEYVIQIPFSQELATFDFPRLTLLVLCCLEAGVHVKVSGFSRHAVRLSFTDVQSGEISISRAILKLKPKAASLQEIAAFYTDSIVYEEDGKCVFAKVNNVNFYGLLCMLVLCHENCVRGSIVARSNQSIELRFHQRFKREGTTYERHPELSTAIEASKDYWSPLSHE